MILKRFDLNSDFSDLYTSMKDFFNVIKCVLTGTVSASTPLSTQISFVFLII